MFFSIDTIQGQLTYIIFNTFTTSVIGPVGFYGQECPQLFHLRKIWFTVTCVNSIIITYPLEFLQQFMHVYAWTQTYIQRNTKGNRDYRIIIVTKEILLSVCINNRSMLGQTRREGYAQPTLYKIYNINKVNLNSLKRRYVYYNIILCNAMCFSCVLFISCMCIANMKVALMVFTLQVSV